MAAAKKEREHENIRNEKMGQPGDVDFQRMIKGFRDIIDGTVWNATIPEQSDTFLLAQRAKFFSQNWY